MAKPEFPIGVVRRWLAMRLGAPPRELRRLAAEGEESQALVVEPAGGGAPLVLRIGTSEEAFRKDARAFRAFGRAALPIPEVLSVAPFDDDHWACVSRFVAGVTLQDSAAATLRALAEPVARVLEAIAASPLDGTRGWGPLDADGAGAHASWEEFLRAPLAAGWEGPDRHAEAVAALLRALAEPDGGPPPPRRLVHGDFGSNNVLTDGRRIVAVLDWECALAGDPLYDAANVFFWAPWLECMRIQAEQLDAALSRDSQVRRRLVRCQLHIGVRELQSLAQEDPDGELDAMVARTLRLLPARERPAAP